jgi:hypothetical protein
MLDTKSFKGLSVFAGVVRYRDLAYLMLTRDRLVSEDVAHVKIYTIDRGKLGGFNFDWIGVSSSVCGLPDERFIALGVGGQVHILGGGQTVSEKIIADGKNTPTARGPLREVRGIAGKHAYAVGTSRQVYKRLAPNRWKCLDTSMPGHQFISEDYCLESIDGFGEDDIYGVGWEGEIWHFDGSKWGLQDSGTNVALLRVKCAQDGSVYACGQEGVLLRGRDGMWERIEQDATDDHLRGLEWFNERLYVSTMSKVYELVKGNLEAVSFGRDPPMTCNLLSAADGIMWSIGGKDVMEFDGNKWQRIVKISD